MSPPLRAPFSPAHPLARQDVPYAQARVFQFTKPQFKGVAEAALYCAHRTSTVSPCAFCEQEGRLATPSPSFRGRALREHRGLTGPGHPIPLLRPFELFEHKLLRQHHRNDDPDGVTPLDSRRLCEL